MLGPSSWRRRRRGALGSIRVAWWNLEILFDRDHGPISRDFEYASANGWTTNTCGAKKANLAAALNELHGGGDPELVGVAELEGDDVLASSSLPWANSHLQVVKAPTATSDLRGIDVSLACDNRMLTLIEKHSYAVRFRYLTRDVFEVLELVEVPGQRLVVIASRWPSRRLGKEHSEPLRMDVAENIAYLMRDRVRALTSSACSPTPATPTGLQAEASSRGSPRPRGVTWSRRRRRAGVAACGSARSAWSTPAAKTVAFVEGVTEIRPGPYIFNDVQQMRLGVATETGFAARMHVTVVEPPTAERFVIDAGRRSSPLTPAMGRHFPGGAWWSAGGPSASSS
jgi:Endonuclease/Exonuclease/phosphatase family